MPGNNFASVVQRAGDEPTFSHSHRGASAAGSESSSPTARTPLGPQNSLDHELCRPLQRISACACQRRRRVASRGHTPASRERPLHPSRRDRRGAAAAAVHASRHLRGALRRFAAAPSSVPRQAWPPHAAGPAEGQAHAGGGARAPALRVGRRRPVAAPVAAAAKVAPRGVGSRCSSSRLGHAALAGSTSRAAPSSSSCSMSWRLEYRC